MIFKFIHTLELHVTKTDIFKPVITHDTFHTICPQIPNGTVSTAGLTQYTGQKQCTKRPKICTKIIVWPSL